MLCSEIEIPSDSPLLMLPQGELRLSCTNFPPEGPPLNSLSEPFLSSLGLSAPLIVVEVASGLTEDWRGEFEILERLSWLPKGLES